jgi:hypothetical protein
MQLSNNLITINRLEKHKNQYFEIKDPSIVQTAADTYMLYASIGNSVRQEWIVGRFISNSPCGIWQELEPVVFSGISGPQMCAPAVTVAMQDDKLLYEMYIQTACFEENGQIVYATSYDGQHFVGQPQPLVSKSDINSDKHPVVGVYDVAVSDISFNNKNLSCMTYSGYRQVGCGDIYVSYKDKNDVDARWSKGQCMISQEDVPFHNKPGTDNFEWGLEGAKLIQLSNSFMLIGVCFIPKPEGFLGTRQRVFIAAAKSLADQFIPIGFPFIPRYKEENIGENGHPDSIIAGNILWVIYQERLGVNDPWHLRSAAFDILKLENFIENKIGCSRETNFSYSPTTMDAYHLETTN